MTEEKVFVFDLDGTILNSKNEFPSETRDAILKIVAKGDKVVLQQVECIFLPRR